MNTLRRIWKELRGLAPWFVIVTITGVIATVIVEFFPPAVLPRLPRPFANYQFFGSVDYFLGNVVAHYNSIFTVLGVCQAAIIVLAASALFGAEFSYGSIQRLLSQPISRNRIWIEKTAVILILVIIVMAIDCSLCRRMASYIDRVNMFRPDDQKQVQDMITAQKFMRSEGLPFLWIMLLVGMTALATGPTVSLWLRQTHTAFWATLVLPFFSLFVLVGCVMLLDVFPGHYGTAVFKLLAILPKWSRESLQLPDGLWQITAPLLAWSAILYPLGWLKFRRLEV